MNCIEQVFLAQVYIKTAHMYLQCFNLKNGAQDQK